MGTSRTASLFVVVVVVAGSLLVMAGSASAQVADTASITGVVRDASGAVLPGVTVEAASPALIDKVRDVVTNGQGLYRIVDLRPGVYTVTFTLPGFSTLRREGLELTTGFTATINAELRVGTVEETVTVTRRTAGTECSGPSIRCSSADSASASSGWSGHDRYRSTSWVRGSATSAKQSRSTSVTFVKKSASTRAASSPAMLPPITIAWVSPGIIHFW